MGADDMKALIKRVALPWLEEAEQSFDTDELAKAGQAVRALLKAYQEQRRTPAPEGEVVAWRTVPVEPTEAMIEAANALWGEGTGVNYVQLEPEDFYAAMIAASPVVPVGSVDALPPISLDGPHKIGEHRQWLARQLLDSRQDDAEAYSTVIYSPAMTDIWRDDVVPVGESREKIVRLLDAVIPETLLDEKGNGVGVSFVAKDLKAKTADTILAALRPTDTGRE